jgi:hypothetical protein
MASKKTKVVEIEAIDNVVEMAVEILELEAVEVKQRGRKVNPDSARQHRLGLKAALIEAGVEIQRGRKIDPNSPRQQRQDAIAFRIFIPRAVVHRGFFILNDGR